MKVRSLIKKLQKLADKHGNIEVIIDYDEHGWYNSEKVETRIHHDEDDEDDNKGIKFINLVSSCEI